MYEGSGKKMLNMVILQILKDYSDENHRLTQQEIIRILKREYDIECDRRSVRNNVECLKASNYQISMEDGYYLMERDFDDVELRMLIDSVLFSKTLSHKQAKNLIEKLKGFGNKYFSAKVSHIYNLPDLHHTDNKQTMYALDIINDAIMEKKKISFVYNDYGTDLKLHPRREERYVVNPYQIVANNGNFYLIGNYDKYDNVSHFRIDRMTFVEMLDEKVKPKNQIDEFKNGYNLPKHMAEHIYMFSGNTVRARFLISSEMMNEVIDWFGKDFAILEREGGLVEISVNCNENAMFFWALQYGPYVEVLAPESLRDEIAKSVKEMSRKYGEGNYDGAISR